MKLDTRNVLNILHEAGFADAHWELLGQWLISGPALLNIRANRHGDPNLCMIDTISQWLRTDLEASWEKLAGAVAKVQQYEQTTANRVREKAGIVVKNVQPPERQSSGRETGTSQQTVQGTHGPGTVILQNTGIIIQSPVQPPPVQPPAPRGRATSRRVEADSGASKGVAGSKRGQKRKGAGVRDSKPPEKKMKQSSGMRNYKPPKRHWKKK